MTELNYDLNPLTIFDFPYAVNRLFDYCLDKSRSRGIPMEITKLGDRYQITDYGYEPNRLEGSRSASILCSLGEGVQLETPSFSATVVDQRLVGTAHRVRTEQQGIKIIFSVSDQLIEDTKKQFVQFYTLIISTNKGSIYRKEDGQKSLIFLDGEKIAEDDHFSFHYDIDNPGLWGKINDSDKRGRSIYRSSVKKIIIEAYRLGCQTIKEWFDRSDGSDEKIFKDVQRLAERPESFGELRVFKENLTKERKWDWAAEMFGFSK